MENILIGKNLALSTIAKTDLIGNLADGELAVFDSNGQKVTASTSFTRNMHFYFVLGQSEGSPLNGLKINPFDFKYACTPYKAPVNMVKKIVLDLPTQAQFDAASNVCCAPHPYKYNDVIVKIWKHCKAKAAYQAGVLPITASYSIGETYNVTTIVTSICDQLTNKLGKGWNVAVANGNEVSITAPTDVYFNATCEGVVVNSVITTATPLTYSVGGGYLTAQQEFWDAAHDGWNPKFEKSLMVHSRAWKDDWRADFKAGKYDTIVIETKTEYQYELLTNDNKGLWKKQFIVVPQGAAVRNTITTLLDGIGTTCKHLSTPAQVL